MVWGSHSSPVTGFIINPELSKALRRHMNAADILLRAWSHDTHYYTCQIWDNTKHSATDSGSKQLSLDCLFCREIGSWKGKFWFLAEKNYGRESCLQRSEVNPGMWNLDWCDLKKWMLMSIVNPYTCKQKFHRTLLRDKSFILIWFVNQNIAFGIN